MGIFTVPVHLHRTRVFVSASDELPNVQLTLYSNHVDNHHADGYMILPVPYPSSVRFHYPHTLSSYGDEYHHFMNCVENAFHDVETYRHSSPRRMSESLARYEVQVLETIDDLREFNQYAHILHETTIDQIARIYRQSYWGFLLCKLHEGNFIYEPLCYSHQIPREHMFIPSLSYRPRRISDVHIPDHFDYNDHKYYINGTLIEDYIPDMYEITNRMIPSIPWDILPRGFAQCLRRFMHHRKHGLLNNRDEFYPINYLLYNHYKSNRRYSIEKFYLY